MYCLYIISNIFVCCMFQAISITTSGKPEEKLELAFRLYDIDRNGKIEEEEMAEIIKVRIQLLSTRRETTTSFPSVRHR